MTKLVLIDGQHNADAREAIAKELEQAAETVLRMEGVPTALGIVVVTRIRDRGYAYHVHTGDDLLALMGACNVLAQRIDQSMQCIAVTDDDSD